MVFYVVHGGIRHLEISESIQLGCPGVHGGIRHLEKPDVVPLRSLFVHGGIRHLENWSALQ